MSVTENGLWIAAPEHIVAAASAELIAETVQLARRDCPSSGKTYLLDDLGIERWDDVVRVWNPALPEDFKFNRVRRLQSTKRIHVGDHRDHPDFQGEVNIMELAGVANAIVEDIGRVALRPGDSLRLVGWPVGEEYPSGRAYQSKISPDDPRTEHRLWYEGPREAIMLVYDANPTNPKEKYT